MSLQEDTQTLQRLKELLLRGLEIIDRDAVISPPPPPDPTDPTPIDPTEPIPIKPPQEQGVILHGGWGGNPDPNTWSATKMVDAKYAGKWKIVDNKGVNIMQEFSTEQNAKDMIEWTKTNLPDPTEPVNPEPQPQPPVTDGGEFPYKTTGKSVEMSQRGPTDRHYASGKPDDWTIEKNAKGIQFPDVQAVFTIEVPKEWEHDDNLSIKLGGTHNGTGWFDNGISVYEGQTCLGTEPEHPETHLCIIKGKKYGDLRGKTVSIASTYFKAENKTEFWVNIGGLTQGWEKSCEGTNVGGFNPKADESEVQLRIDGFKEKDQPPNITKFVVNEIQK